ncbi:hypothetical protein QUA00_19580 [Microcoleus sp. T2B6]|uniref:DUF6753 family protein n=1 Tax=Microcoleus sp. T2B6 TaxID=3055424 RepID=UPI002FD62AC8
MSDDATGVSDRKIENLSEVELDHDFSEETVEHLVNDENLEDQDEEDENSDSYLWQQIDQELTTAKTSVGDNLFKLAAPPAFEHERESLISQALKGKSAEFRSEVINNAYRYGLDKNDPLFIVLLATGQLELLLEKKPQEIDSFFRNWESKWQAELKDSEAVISQELEQVRQLIDNWEQDSREFLERQGKAAVNVQHRKIASSVKTLVQQAALEKVAHDIWSVIFGSAAVLGAIAIGVFIGLAIPKFAHTPPLDPKGPRQLTLKEAVAMNWGLSAEGQFAMKNAEAIKWAMSSEGKYAQQFMSWNQALLSEKNGKMLCESEVNRLGVTLTVEGKAATDGFCTLWTRNPKERVFAP